MIIVNYMQLKEDKNMETRDIYECYSRGFVFSDRELKMAIKHYKDLSNILMVSGREFHLAANEAIRVY